MRIRLVTSILIVFLISLGCQKRSQSSDRTKQANDSEIPGLTTIDSLATTPKPILEQGVAVDHSLSEIDTNSASSLRLSLVRHDGELFLFDSTLFRPRQITFTRGKVDTFFLSPNGRFVACLKVVAVAKEPGEWGGEEPPDTPIYSIVVIQLPQANIVRELQTSDFNLCVTKWISNSRLHYTVQDGFAVSAYYVYDASRDTLQLLPYGATQ